MEQKKQAKGYGPLVYKASTWLAYIALAVSGLALIFEKATSEVVSIVVLFSILLLASNFFTYLGMAKPLEDERARKIGTMAATWSWYITLAFVSFLVVFGYWNGRSYTGAEAFGVTISAMAVSMAVVSAYLGMKGDID